MKLLIAVVGAPRQPGLADAIAAYEERIRHYFKLEVREVPASKGGSDAAASVREESKRLLGSVPEGLEIVALDERGKSWSSEELASYLDELAVLARPGAAFLIGGPDGHSPELRDRADRTLSLSRFTLPHELARLVLTEQIYRAGTILRGEPYHRGR